MIVRVGDDFKREQQRQQAQKAVSIDAACDSGYSIRLGGRC
jgi:hypothetical protein